MNTLSVSELTSYIKRNLEKDFACLKVSGEISNLTVHSSGHIYFTLKDENSQISCAFFKQARKNSAITPKNGDQITVYGDLSVYPPRGSYQIIIKKLEKTGLGDLLLKLHALKEECKKLGWFNPETKKPLPLFPKKIGVITSPTGAVIKDILHVLRKRFPGFQLILYPVKVQGETAHQEIAQAIYECNRLNLCDVLIVGRGGGSLEDLWAFNEKAVVEAVFLSKIPIISAVGHETDNVLSDLAADARASTPSRAAEMVVQELDTLMKFLNECAKKCASYLQKTIEGKKRNLAIFSKMPHFSDPSYFLANWSQRIDEKKSSLQVLMRHQMEKKRQQLSYIIQQQIQKKPLEKIRQKKEALSRFQKHLKAIHPENLQEKGYTILFSENKSSVILSVDELKQGDTLIASLKDGEIHTNVSRIQKGRKS